jgi:hypothetical protein
MGWYLRKGFNFGPFRLNLSKSGFGISTGVKGARLGVDSKGKKYIHFGRGGLYYRKTLDPDQQTAEGRLPSRLPTWLFILLLFLIGILVIIVGM